MTIPKDMADPAAPRIAMIVWNTFDSDARVQKEIATLNRAGYVVHVFCRRATPSGPTTEHRGPGLVVERFPRATGRDTLGAAGFVAAPTRRSRAGQILHMTRQLVMQQQMVRAMVAIRPRVVHAHDLNTLIPALQAARRAGVPLIYDAHEFNMDRIDQNNWLRPAFRRLEGYALRHAARVIVPSPGIARALARFYGVQRPDVLGNWPMLDTTRKPSAQDLRARLGIGAERVVGLYQGGLQPHRGLHHLVAAAAGVPGLDLVLMGDGRLRDALAAQITALGTSARIHLMPPEPLDQLLALTMTADFGVHPLEASCLNHAYASPNKLFEYLHAGLPVIMTDLPEARRVLNAAPAGNPAILVPPGDQTALRDALQMLTNTPKRRAVLAHRAKAAGQMYCWQMQEDTLTRLYQDVCGG
ncbi:glycosyltransferase [Roseinatronobacter sp. NSM]|uniref:glycosyltransferase n=1 Tax=Roseinatronobacter sp. NSM TaxID=3457785 RepID=UPI004035BF15